MNQQEILERIPTATGRQLFNLMRQMWKLNMIHSPLWEACKKRAAELSPNKFGDWQQAKQRFSTLAMPTVWSKGNATDLPRIEGYEVWGIRTVNDSNQPTKDMLVMLNPNGESSACKEIIYSKNGKVVW